jgi:hypothetical protein
VLSEGDASNRFVQFLEPMTEPLARFQVPQLDNVLLCESEYLPIGRERNRIHKIAGMSEKALLGELVRNLVVKLPAPGLAWFTKVGGKSGAVLAGLLRDARKTAPDGERPVAERVTAIRMLRVAEFTAVKDMAPQLLNFRQPQAVQAAIVETLARFDEAAVPALLLDAWPGLSPQLRASAVETFFSRPAWIATFLDAVEQGKINRGDVDPSRIQLLQKHPHAKLRDRAATMPCALRMLPTLVSDRSCLRLASRPLDAIIAPAWIVSCQAHHQLLNLLCQCWTTRLVLAALAVVPFLGHQQPVPA